MRKRPNLTLPFFLLCIVIALPLFAHPQKRLEWAISDGSHQTMVATNRDGHSAIRRLERELDGPFIWLRQDGHEYVITDPATIEKFRAMFDDLAEIDDLELDLEIDVEEIEALVEEELETKMKRLEARMEEIEDEIDRGSFAALAEIGDVVAEIDLERIEEIARIAEVTARQVELRAGDIEAWAHDLETRIDEEAIPLLEDAIRDGIARPISR